MSTTPTISEEELHAYVDGHLDAEQRLAVERYLAANPEYARRAEAYTAQRDALRQALAWRANEPVPASLSLSPILNAQWHRRPRRWQMAAAAVLALAVGAAGGWAGRGAMPAPEMGNALLTSESTAAHRVFAPDALHPVEIRADARETLLIWLSARLGTTVVAPDLQAIGFRFMGGRLVSTPHGPAGLLMYDDDRGTRLTLYVRRMLRDVTLPLHASEADALSSYTWADGGIGYAVTARTLNPDVRLSVGEIRRQIARHV